LVIANVEQGTPFYRGGLRQGDVIVAWNGQQIRSEDDFGRWASERRGQRIPVIVLRDGSRETVYITYDQDRNRQSYDGLQSYAQQAYDSQAFLGVRFETRGRGGAVISDVVSGGPAEQAGLKAGDELVAINGREVNSGREVTRIVASMQPGDRLDIEYSRRVENRTQAVLESRQGDVASARYDRSSDMNRQGGQYDGIEQSSYDEQSASGAAIEYNSGERTIDRNYDRRNGRTLLPRLRN
jgi:S1-C subfamily serine protease